AGERVGDQWRSRWDSMRLFSPAKYDGLDGMPFPAEPWSLPTREEFAEYLEAYAAAQELPVRSGVRVTGVHADGDGYVVTAGDQSYAASSVVLATGTHQVPRRATCSSWAPAPPAPTSRSRRWRPGTARTWPGRRSARSRSTSTGSPPSW